MQVPTETLTGMFTWEWWVSVFVVGIMVHLVAAYLYSRLDKLRSKLSAGYRARRDTRMAERVRRIASLRADKHDQVLLLFDEIRNRIGAILFMLLGLTLFSFMIATFETPRPYAREAAFVMGIVGVISLLFGAFNQTAAFEHQDLLATALSGEEKPPKT